MANKCLESYSSDLNNQHSKLVKEGMSDRGAAMKLALDEYNKFYEDLNSLETSLGIPLTAKPKLENAEKIASIETPVEGVKVATAVNPAARAILNQLGYSNTQIDSLPREERAIILANKIVAEDYFKKPSEQKKGIVSIPIGTSGKVNLIKKEDDSFEISNDEDLQNTIVAIQNKTKASTGKETPIDDIVNFIKGKFIIPYIQSQQQKPIEIDDELDSASDTIEDDEDSEYRQQVLNETRKFEEENWPKVEQWLKKNFPNIPVYRVKNMIEATGGRKAWGMLHQGAIYLYQHAETGTAYHEVFEAVWKMLTSPEEQNNIINEFRSREGSFTDRFNPERVIKYSEATPQDIKEELAEEFRDYILYNAIPAKLGKNWIVRLFYDIVKIIKQFFTGSKALSNTEQLFERIGSGYYKDASIYANQLRYATQGFIDVDSAVADSTSDLRLNIPAQQLNDVVQHMVYFTLTKIIDTDEGLFGVENLTKETKQELSDQLYNTILNKLAARVKLFKTAQENNEIQKDVASKEIVKINNIWLQIKNNWGDVIKSYQEKLYTLGIQFDENDELALTEDKAKEDPYGDSRKIDSYRKANSAVKLLLSTLPVMENGKPKKSSIGGVVVMPSDKVFFTLKNKLHDALSIDEMLDRISKMASKDENYVKLYRRLTKTNPGTSVDYSKLGREGLHLLAAFHKSMKSQQPDVVGLFTLPSGEVIVGDSSLAGATKQAKREMISNLIDASKKGNKYIKYDAKTSSYNYTGAQINLDPNKLETYTNFLKELGISINTKDLKQIRKFKSIVEGIKKSVTSIKGVKSLSTKTLGDLDGRLTELGELKAMLENPEFESTYFNMNGDRVQSFIGVNIMSNFYDVFSKIKNLYSDLAKSTHSYLLSDVFTKGSVILNKVFDMESGDRVDGTESIMKPVIVDGVDDATKGKTKDSSMLSPKERLLAELNLNNEGIYLVLVPGDSSMDHAVRLHNKKSPFVAEGEDHHEIFKNYFISEVLLSRDNRIINKRDKNELRFFKDILGEKLARAVSKDKLSSPEDLYLKYEKEIKSAIDSFIEVSTEATYNRLNQYGIIKEDELEGLSFIEDFTEKGIKNKLRNLNTNYIIANIELHKLIYSDPYQYSDELKRIKNFTSPKQAVVSNSLGFTNAMNRIYNEGFSEGDIGYANNNREYFRTVTLADIFAKDELYSDEHPYEETDGGGYITLKAKRTFMIRAGEWSEDNERQYRYDIAYEKHYKNLPMSSDEKKIFEEGNPGVKETYTTVKPIAAGSKVNGREYNDIDLDKFALVTLSYRILHELNPNSNAIKLYNKWQKEDIDYGVYSTGRKGGAEIISPIYNEDGSFDITPYSVNDDVNKAQAIINIPFNSLFIQSEVPSKEIAKTTEGSQLTKLATMDLLDAGVPQDFMTSSSIEQRISEWDKLSEAQKETISPLHKEIANNEKLLRARIEQGYSSLLKKLGIKQTEEGFELEDRGILIDTLSSEIMKQEINSNIKKAFEAFEKEEVVLESTPTYTQIRNILYSIADHNVVRKKITGGMKVQIPSSLLESERVQQETVVDKKGNKKTIFKSEDLAFYRDEDGKRVCEIMVGRWFKSNMSDEELLNYLNETEEGQKILGGIGFRIPTQKQNSIDVFKIKKFLPKDFGDQVVIPSALVKKVGSDFDIDKLSIYLKNVFKSKDGKIKIVPYFGIGESARNKFVEMFNNGELLSKEDYKLLQEELKKEREHSSGAYEIVRKIFGDLANFTDEEIKEDFLDNLYDSGAKEAIIDKFYKESLENAYIQSLENLVSHPLNFKNLIKPNSADQLKDLTKKINAKLGRKEVDYSSVGNMLDRMFMQDLRYNFLTGKKIIGIAAVGQTNNAQNQRTIIDVDVERLSLVKDEDAKWLGDVKIKLPKGSFNTINGKPTLSLSKSTDGSYISDVISQIIDGSVDVSKHPWLMELGVSQSTSSTWIFLLKLGIPVDTVAYFMNQPIVKTYIESIQNAGYSWMFIEDFVTEAKKLYSTDDKTTISEIPSDKLYGMIGKTNKELSAKENKTQQFILDEFLKYSKMANHLFMVVQATNLDTANLNDPFLIMRKDVQYEKAKSTIISSVEKLMNSSFVGTLRGTLNNIRNAYSTILLSDRDNKGAGKYTIRDIMTSILTPYTDSNERDFVKISRKAVSDLFDWAIQTKSGLNNKLASILIGNETEASVAEQIIEFKNKVLANKNHPLYDNIILNSIALQGNIKEGKKSKVNNLVIVGKDNKAFEQDLIISSFNELKQYLGTEKGGLYEKLIRLAILQSGLTNSPISFTQLLPYEDFKYFYNDPLLSLESNPDLIKFYELHSFERNNWANGDIVPLKRDKMKRNKRGEWFYPSHNFIDLPLKRLLKAETDGVIPKVVAISNQSQEGRHDFISYQWEDNIPLDEKKEMRKKGDYSFIHKTLMQKVYITNENNERVPLVHTSSFVDKETGKSVVVKKYIYKAINAWGDSFRAKEFYNEAKPSVLDNGYEKIQNEVEDEVIAKIYNNEAEKPVSLPEDKGIKTMNIKFEEHPISGYRERTIKNASADATIAIASDFNTAGEKLTRSSVLNQKKLYLPVSTDIFSAANKVDMMAGKIVSEISKLGKSFISLNIAGNGIYSLKNIFPGGQKSIDNFTFELLKNVVDRLKENNIIVDSIRTGGQTGFDESGAKAGIKLGIPTTILAPKGWIFRNVLGQDISSEKEFKNRFVERTTLLSEDLQKEINPKSLGLNTEVKQDDFKC